MKKMWEKLRNLSRTGGARFNDCGCRGKELKVLGE